MEIQDIIVEFHQGEYVKKDGIGKNSGKPYEMTIQTGFVTFPGKRYPEEIEIVHFGGDPVHPPGRYKVDTVHSLYVSNKRIMLGKVQLVPLAAAQASPAAAPATAAKPQPGIAQAKAS